MKKMELIERRPLRQQVRNARRMQPYGRWRSAWLTLASMLIISIITTIGCVDPYTHRFEEGFHLGVCLLTNLAEFAGCYAFCFTLARRGVKPSAMALWGLLGSMAIAVSIGSLSYAIEIELYGCTIYSYFINIIVRCTTALIAYLISLLLVNVTKQQLIEVDNEQLQAENLRIRYESLARQMSPHFLFNSLNTLDALISTSDPRSHPYLQNLAESYRYVLNERSEVLLAEEMQFTHAYIEMMLIRFGEALSVEEQIDAELLSRRVPPISVQLLVENAIKHNVVSTRHPMNITIRTTDHETLLVSNPMHLKQPSTEPSGLGLGNLSGRYCLLCGRDLNISRTDGVFSVEIPLI